jgi:hypothetical protein
VYDKAKWHYEGDFPDDLDESAAFTHTGFLVCWVALRGLLSSETVADYGSELEKLKARAREPTLLYRVADGVFDSTMVNEEARRFFLAYDQDDYLDDYNQQVVPLEYESIYHVAPTWENYDEVAAILDRRLADWRDGQR